MKIRNIQWWSLLMVAGVVAQAVNAADLKTRNVLLVTLDGLRWQEVFTGAEEALLNPDHGGVEEVDAMRKQFWRDTAEERRQVLMPFLWKVVAREGQLFGQRTQGSLVNLKNQHKFSYPGYNEILTGVPDPKIDSNGHGPNENMTVLEWLHTERGYKGKIAAFCAWEVFSDILNPNRSGIPVMAGWNPLPEPKPNARQTQLNELLQSTTRVWDSVTYDAFVFQAAMEHLKRHRPRVLYVAFGETDDWAHDGRYDHVLKTARAADDYIRRLWETMQGMRQYAGKTTLIITVDHGRGTGLEQWKNHGAKVAGAEETWMAFLGPDTPALGARQNTKNLTTGQVASSVAAFLGEDYSSTRPEAPPPVGEAIGGKP